MCREILIAARSLQGNRFAKGITNYSSLFVERIKGLKSDCITQKYLDYTEEEVIHRDNLGLL